MSITPADAEKQIKEIEGLETMPQDVKEKLVRDIRSKIKHTRNNDAVKGLLSKRLKTEPHTVRINNDGHLVSQLFGFLELPRDRLVPFLIQAMFIDPADILAPDTNQYKSITKLIADIQKENPALVALIKENPQLQKCTTNYEHAARKSIEDDVIYVMQRTAPRLLASEILVCRGSYVDQNFDTTKEIWKIVADALCAQGADWMLSEGDVSKVRESWFEKDDNGRITRKATHPAKRPRDLF